MRWRDQRIAARQYAGARRVRVGPLAVAALALVAASPLAPGIWGAPGAELAVGERGATLRLECAEATLGGPITPGADGSFRVTGRFDAHTGGPQPAHEERAATPAANALVVGQVDDDRMTLEIRVDGETTPRRFTLERGRRVKLIRCF